MGFGLISNGICGNDDFGGSFWIDFGECRTGFWPNDHPLDYLGNIKPGKGIKYKFMKSSIASQTSKPTYQTKPPSN